MNYRKINLFGDPVVIEDRFLDLNVQIPSSIGDAQAESLLLFVIQWINDTFSESFLLDWHGKSFLPFREKALRDLQNNFCFFRVNGLLRGCGASSITGYRRLLRSTDKAHIEEITSCMRQKLPIINPYLPPDTESDYFASHFLTPSPKGSELHDAIIRYFYEPDRVALLRGDIINPQISFTFGSLRKCVDSKLDASFHINVLYALIEQSRDSFLELLEQLMEQLISRCGELYAVLTLQPLAPGGGYLFNRNRQPDDMAHIDEIGTIHWLSPEMRNPLSKPESRLIDTQPLLNGGLRVAIQKPINEIDVADYAIAKRFLYPIILPSSRFFTMEQLLKKPFRAGWVRVAVFDEEIEVTDDGVWFRYATQPQQ